MTGAATPTGRSGAVRAIGILGGTFDPVHCAHIRLALELRAALRLDSVRLMPAPNPRLRDPPVASPEVRMRLLEAALEDVPGLEATDASFRTPGRRSPRTRCRSCGQNSPRRPCV